MDEIAYAGNRLSIVFAGLSGGSPALTFYESLSDLEQNRLMALFVRLADTGVLFNREQFKKVEGTEFFEFKRNDVRMLCRFLKDARLLLLHGFRKKQDRIPQRELERTKQIWARWQTLK